MSSATLPFQEYKGRPLSVVVAVPRFSCSYLVRGGGEVIFDQQVILPFASLLVAPLLYALFRQENPVWH